MSSERNLTDRDMEQLSAYLDDSLSSEERAALEARLLNEPDLRRELAELRQTVALVHDFGRVAAPRNFTLTPSMVRPPKILLFPATAAVSLMSAVAAIVLVAAGALLLARPAAPTTLTGAPAALTSQIAFAPTSTIDLRAQTANGIVAEATGLPLDKVTQATEPALNQPVAGGVPEISLTTVGTADTTLDDGLFAAEASEEAPMSSYMSRSAMPTLDNGALTDAEDQQTLDGDLFSTSASAQETSPVEAPNTNEAQPAPMAMALASSPTPEPPSISQLFAPNAQSNTEASGGAAAADSAIAQLPSETPTATFTDTATVTSSPSPTNTVTPTPTNTATATMTASPTMTNTPVPSVTPSPTPAPLIQLSGGQTNLVGLLLIVVGAAALLLSLSVILARRRG